MRRLLARGRCGAMYSCTSPVGPCPPKRGASLPAGRACGGRHGHCGVPGHGKGHYKPIAALARRRVACPLQVRSSVAFGPASATVRASDGRPSSAPPGLPCFFSSSLVLNPSAGRRWGCAGFRCSCLPLPRRQAKTILMFLVEVVFACKPSSSLRGGLPPPCPEGRKRPLNGQGQGGGVPWLSVPAL